MVQIRRRLQSHHVATDAGQVRRRAAVAAIFRVFDGEPEILFIKRAERNDDPWSGQMAFPGGHVDDVDANARAAAERETREEIGLDLTHHGHFLGALSPEVPGGGGLITVEPFVYELTTEPTEYDLNYEVAELHWSKIGPMLRQETLASVDWPIAGQVRAMPGFDVNGRIVWGLTFRVLIQLFQLIEPEFGVSR